MKQLLRLHGDCIVINGKNKGARYADLNDEALARYAKRAVGEPELLKFCRTALALKELDQLENHIPPAAQEAQLAVVPYLKPAKSAGSTSCESSETESFKWLAAGSKQSKKVWKYFWALPVVPKLLVGYLTVVIFFVVFTSPWLARAAGEAIGHFGAETMKLVGLRLYDFWSTFHFSMLQKLGLLYHEPEPVVYRGHELADIEGPPRVSQIAAGSPWNQFVHELGTATVGALSVAVSYVAYLWLSAGTATAT
jgi:hypothetical protein